MPPVIAGAALSAVVAGSAFSAGVLTIGFSVASFAGSLILGGLSYALTPKPPKPSGLDNRVASSTVAVRQPDLTRQHVYGHTRITRGFAHMESTGINGRLHIILILCEGPLRAINEIWFNDYCIPQDWIDADGNVTQGRYAGYLTVKKHLGEVSQGADIDAIANMPSWSSDFKLQGTAYLYLILKKNQDVYPTGVPNISAIVEGPALYDPRADANVWSTNVALYAHDYLRNSEYGFGVLAEDIDAVNVAAQANICDEIVNTNAENFSVIEAVAATDIMEIGGDVLSLQFGDRVTLSTTGTLPGGLATVTNYYTIPFQVKTKPRIRLATSLANAMAKIYVDITSAGTGTHTLTKTGEPRYHGSGIIDTETALSQNLNDIVTSMAGRAIMVGGFWTLLAGAYRAPAITLTPGDVRGNSFAFQGDLSMSESFNVVKGLFVSSINLYQNSDYPSAKYDSFIDRDNGIQSDKDINLPFTNRPTTAQRIAKIELFRGQQGIAVRSQWSLKALQVQPGDTVELDEFDWLGWADPGKEFEVTDFGFDYADGNLVTEMTLRETAAEIYDWTEGEAIDYDPAPNTNLTDPFSIMAVTGLSYNSRPTGTQDGDVIYTLQLQWDEHPDAFVRENGQIEVQYKLADSTEWLPGGPPIPGRETKSDVVNSSVNVYYDLRARAVNNLGVRSGWNTILGAVVGSSGGVTTTNDWGNVADAVTTSLDWGNVADAPTAFEDWGEVV